MIFTELDSQLQHISNGGRSMIESFDIVHIHMRGDNRGRVEITHIFLQ